MPDPQDDPGRRRVLVIDDGQLNRRLCDRFLASLGCEAVCVEDMEAALAVAPGGGFDLVLCDVMLPGVSGVSGLADLRKALDDGTVGGPAIVAMSSQALGPDPAAYRAAGFDDYLPKPVMLDVLRSGLERWIADNP